MVGRIYQMWLLLFVCCGVLFWRMFLRFEHHQQPSIKSEKLVILMWTKYYGVTGSLLHKAIYSGRKWIPNCCPDSEFFITFDRNYLSQATVLVFFNHRLNLKKEDLPPFRLPNQIWVLFSKESPTLTFVDLSDFPGMFNWTMSYRRDSDIPAPYGFTVRKSSSGIKMPGGTPLHKWISGKSKLLCGLISHCETSSQREKFIESLQSSGFPVDVYGKCGNLSSVCLRTDSSCDHTAFWKQLSSSYRFYFSAENSLCIDYITEKFWRALEQGMVPVVYGGANYTAVAPPNSFIDTRNFKSTDHLAQYLTWFSRNPEEYAKFFEWRRNFKVVLTDGWHAWCELCQRAKFSMEESSKSYRNLAEWWLFYKDGDVIKSACEKPSF